MGFSAVIAENPIHIMNGLSRDQREPETGTRRRTTHRQTQEPDHSPTRAEEQTGTTSVQSRRNGTTPDGAKSIRRSPLSKADETGPPTDESEKRPEMAASEAARNQTTQNESQKRSDIAAVQSPRNGTTTARELKSVRA